MEVNEVTRGKLGKLRPENKKKDTQQTNRFRQFLIKFVKNLLFQLLKQFVLIKKIISKNKDRIVYAEVFWAKSVRKTWADMHIQNELTLHRAQ